MPDTPIKPMPRRQPNVVQLPPSGHAQREEIKQRGEQLSQQAEERATQLGSSAIDPATIAEDPEILHNFDGLHVTNAQPGFTYSWKLYDSRFNVGYWVQWAKAQGWQVVCGDMLECKEHEIAGGLRKIGDCILMRIPNEKKAALDRRDADLVKMKSQGVHSNLRQLGADKGVIVKVSELDQDLAGAMAAKHRGTMAGNEKYYQKLRDGSLLEIKEG